MEKNRLKSCFGQKEGKTEPSCLNRIFRIEQAMYFRELSLLRQWGVPANGH